MEKKDFIWFGLRISFFVMALIWLGESIFLPNDIAPEDYWTGFMVVVSLIFTISAIFTFVTSIVHLVKYKEKAFAITSLVISSILVLFFISPPRILRGLSV